MQRFADKTAVVTGGALGIGRAIVRRLAGEGAAVAILDIKDEAAAAVAAECVAGGRALALHCDVCQSESVSQAVAAVLAEFGQIDVLVNCAGLYAENPPALFKDKPEAVWLNSINLNLCGTMRVAHAVAGHMAERRAGSIVNIGSIAGAVGIRNMAAYSAAKGGVAAFTRALAIEMGPFNVNVNCVSPGAIAVNDANVDWQDKGIYLPRKAGYPEDVANLVAFLASAEGAYITGADYIIDGGRVLGPRGH